MPQTAMVSSSTKHVYSIIHVHVQCIFNMYMYFIYLGITTYSFISLIIIACTCIMSCGPTSVSLYYAFKFTCISAFAH